MEQQEYKYLTSGDGCLRIAGFGFLALLFLYFWDNGFSLPGSKRSLEHQFSRLLDTEPTPDVKNIRYHADEMIDASYWLSCTCDEATVTRIISNLGLKRDEYGAAHSTSPG